LSPCVLDVAFCESDSVGDVANVLFCSGFVVGCGVGVVSAHVISTGSIPAASTIFEERNSLLLKGIVFSCSSPTAAFCMNIALSAAGAGGADTLVHPLDRPGHPRCRLPGRKRRASAVRSNGGLTPGCPLGVTPSPAQWQQQVGDTACPASDPGRGVRHVCAKVDSAGTG